MADPAAFQVRNPYATVTQGVAIQDPYGQQPYGAQPVAVVQTGSAPVTVVVASPANSMACGLLVGAAVLSFIAAIFAIAAAATTKWAYGTLSESTPFGSIDVTFSAGLLRYCISAMGVDGGCSMYSGSEDYAKKGRAATVFLALGIILALVSLTTAVIAASCAGCSNRASCLRASTVTTNAVATGLVLIGFAVGTSIKNSANVPFELKTGYSAGLAVISWVFLGFATGLSGVTLARSLPGGAVVVTATSNPVFK